LPDDVHRVIERFEVERPKIFNIVDYTQFHLRCYKRPEDRDHWLDGYRKAGLAV
jgi:hypothetical protein